MNLEVSPINLLRNFLLTKNVYVTGNIHKPTNFLAWLVLQEAPSGFHLLRKDCLRAQVSIRQTSGEFIVGVAGAWQSSNKVPVPAPLLPMHIVSPLPCQVPSLTLFRSKVLVSWKIETFRN